MMGSGKSSVGRTLASLTSRSFEDTDLLLEHRFGRTVSQIFKVYGEEAFREHEASVLRSLQPGKCVLSTGGGIILRDSNWDEMRRLGMTVYLRASKETLAQRLEVSKRKRPLLMVEDWEDRLDSLLEARRSLYEKADIIVDTGLEPIEEIAERAKSLIESYEAGR